jgi:ribosomal protein S18 acetylase RimI-like enzyme
MNLRKAKSEDLKTIIITGQRGCRKISLNVYRNNPNAFKLYEELGFREISERSSKEICHMVLGDIKML